MGLLPLLASITIDRSSLGTSVSPAHSNFNLLNGSQNAHKKSTVFITTYKNTTAKKKISGKCILGALLPLHHYLLLQEHFPDNESNNSHRTENCVLRSQPSSPFSQFPFILDSKALNPLFLSTMLQIVRVDQ